MVVSSNGFHIMVIFSIAHDIGQASAHLRLSFSLAPVRAAEVFLFFGAEGKELVYSCNGWWWLEHGLKIFPYIGNVIIPTDELIFFGGVAQPPTSWRWWVQLVFFTVKSWWFNHQQRWRPLATSEWCENGHIMRISWGLSGWIFDHDRKRHVTKPAGMMLCILGIIPLPIGSMVYMLTWLGYIDGIHVTIYSSTMDPSWVIVAIFRLGYRQRAEVSEGEIIGDMSWLENPAPSLEDQPLGNG